MEKYKIYNIKYFTHFEKKILYKYFFIKLKIKIILVI